MIPLYQNVFMIAEKAAYGLKVRCVKVLVDDLKIKCTFFPMV